MPTATAPDNIAAHEWIWEGTGMTDLERLVAIEEIKRCKSRYFYCFDNKDWDGWRRDVFAPDAAMVMPDAQPEPIVGVETIIAWAQKVSEGIQSVHHGHMPDIVFTSDTTAKVIWAMEDQIHWPKPMAKGHTRLHGWGHYHETYVKLAAGWRIKDCSLTRLRIEWS
jgi:hypothetical protein